MRGLRVPEPEAPQYALVEGVVPHKNIGSWLVLSWKGNRAGHKLPPVDGKAGLRVMTVL